MELMKKTFYGIGVAISAIIALIIPSLIGGALLMVAWNAIAWEFNLPQFGYWVCVCAYCVVHSLTTKTVTVDSKK